MDLVSVRARDCACPGTPHEDGDIVYLLPKADLNLGVAAEQDIIASRDSIDGPSELLRRWTVTYVRHGAKGWNLLDDKGKAVPFTVDTILDDYTFARPIAEAANDLYAEAVMTPLVKRLNGRSQTGPMDGSTSPRVQSIRKRRGSSSPDISAASEPLTA